MAVSSTSVFSNLTWRFLERIGAQGITFVVSIVLARLLDPGHFGQVALITVFTNFLYVFVDSGFGSALIQKKDADEMDFSTVFYFNLAMCSVLYVLLFLCAPWIAKFYNDMAMVPMIRVAGLTLLVSGVKNVQQAYVSRNMMFRKFFYATLGGTIFSAFLGIFLAYEGMGTWALIFQQLSNTCIDTVILWIVVKWRPVGRFSRERFKGLFSFGWKLLVSSLLETAYQDLKQLVIGKKYTKEDLAYFNNGHKLPSVVVGNVNSSIGSVLFPALSSEQSDRSLVKSHVRRAIRTSSFIMWPMLMGLAACAEPLVRLVLTDKWLPSVPYLRIACFCSGLMPIHTTNLQAIKALGRSDWFLRLEIAKKIVGLTVIFIAMRYGVMAIAVSGIFSSIIATLINSYPNRKLIGYSYWEQIKDILPSFGLASFMAGVVFMLGKPGWSPAVALLIQVPCGILIYVGGAVLFKMESYRYVLDFIKQTLAKARSRRTGGVE